MIITERRVKVADIFEGYFNDNEDGVVGYDEQLDIRPKYQREFVYDAEQQREVVRSVIKGLPLNVMYWVDRWADPDHPTNDELAEARYELLDGQQRTLSLCAYIDGDFSVDDMTFDNQPADIRQRILDYELFVYICRGNESEKLEWFKIINIAGEKLTDQERRNAVYAGPWVSDAKRYFSKTRGPAESLAGDYLKGSAIRQEYLETAIFWAASVDGLTIERYMSVHQHDPSAVMLWNYFRSVIDWVGAIFPHYRREMKGLPWGLLYNDHKDRRDLDPAVLEERIVSLLGDEDVTRRAGIYEYLLTGDERKLSIRAFDKRDMNIVYARQNGRCAVCGGEFEFNDMQGDHIVPWSQGGHTTLDNLQMLCRRCNLLKSAQLLNE